MGDSGRTERLVGKATDPMLFEIEKGQIRRVAVAIGEDNPIHHDEVAAKAAGYSSLVATPTFPAALDNLDPLYERLGIDAQGMMHAEEEYEYFRPIVAGDRITVQHRVVDAYEKEGPNGTMLFVVIESRGSDDKARPVYKGRRILVELRQ